jgi:hypothetical protein
MGEGESDRSLIQGATAFILKEFQITTNINSTIIIACLYTDTKTQKKILKRRSV